MQSVLAKDYLSRMCLKIELRIEKLGMNDMTYHSINQLRKRGTHNDRKNENWK